MSITIQACARDLYENMVTTFDYDTLLLCRALKQSDRTTDMIPKSRSKMLNIWMVCQVSSQPFEYRALVLYGIQVYGIQMVTVLLPELYYTKHLNSGYA